MKIKKKYDYIIDKILISDDIMSTHISEPLWNEMILPFINTNYIILNNNSNNISNEIDKKIGFYNQFNKKLKI